MVKKLPHTQGMHISIFIMGMEEISLLNRLKLSYSLKTTLDKLKLKEC